MRSQRPSMVQTPAQYYFIFLCINYEYLYGETSFTKDTLSEHLERLQEAFPCTEDSRMDKEYEGALDIIIPGSLDIEIALSNEDKNRPGAGITMDLNRVCLRDPLCSGDDYINASFIGCFGRKAEYIITQHPLKNTIEDFWKMILERHINSVVIIGAVSEQDEYWPGEEEFNFDGICVTLVDKYSEGYIEICSFEVEYEETEDYQKVTIFQLTSWPTKDDVPSETKSILQLIEFVNEHKEELVTIHTSANVQGEASGVFCIINSLIPMLKAGIAINVMETTKRVLQQRPGTISSKEQYEFIYDVLFASIN
jgi:protein tyrosine phosphatase